MLKLKSLVVLVVTVFATSQGAAFAAGVEEWPTRPIELYVGYAAGGTGDIATRMFAPLMSKELGVPVVVMNKPGATGGVLDEYIARAKPDGYTIKEGGYAPLTTRPFFMDTTFTYRDYTFILSYSDFGYAIVVRKDAPWKDFKELIEYGRKNPVKYATSGAYSTGHLVMDWITRREGIKAIHAPLKSSGDATTQVLGGHVDMYCGSGAEPLVEGGRLRTLLQLNGEAESTKIPHLTEVYPDLPEALRLTVACPTGLAGPKGIPAPIVQKLAKALKKATEDEKFRRFLKREARGVVVWESEEIFKNLGKMYEAYPALLKEAGFVKK